MQKFYFKVNFTHSEETFKALAHMQYDLFCKRNLVARTLVALACLGVSVIYLDRWWAYILIVYGVYLATGRYNQANHTARKLVKGIQDAHLPFPSSSYFFEEDRMRVISRPDGDALTPLMYDKIVRLGKDNLYYYLFPNEHGGYMIPKEALGDKEQEFTDFMTEKTGQIFCTKRTPPVRRFIQYIKYHRTHPNA